MSRTRITSSTPQYRIDSSLSVLMAFRLGSRGQVTLQFKEGRGEQGRDPLLPACRLNFSYLFRSRSLALMYFNFD